VVLKNVSDTADACFETLYLFLRGTTSLFPSRCQNAI
jgi:hypothetical protein